MSTYFLIRNSEGETRVEQMSRETLMERIAIEDGTTYYGDIDFIEDLKQTDTNYWGNGVLIIKGDIMTPTPKDVVKTYEID